VRFLQNIFLYPAYRRHLDGLWQRTTGFKGRIRTMVEDGCNGVHLLRPVITAEGSAFLTSNSDPVTQALWRQEQGLPAVDDPYATLLAQIEAHRAEVFYTQDPSHHGPDFLRRLPGCVRYRICWQSPPAPPGDLSSYDLVLNNFPESLARYSAQGVRTEYFTPSHDPLMDEFAPNQDRPIDVAFVGGYSRHHLKRSRVLSKIAELGDRYRITFALDRGRLTRLAESPFGYLLPLGKHRRPREIRTVSVPALFGRDMYRLFSRAKIVLNGAVDSAGDDRGNMRCFEALGCGALLVTDAGRYPAGMADGQTMRTYDSADGAGAVVEAMLENGEDRRSIALRGVAMLRDAYSKERQWQRFQELVAQL
jgi:hypothetical protein